jgi:hypothetical protein
MPSAKKALTEDERKLLDGAVPLKSVKNSPGVLGPSTYWEDIGQDHGKWPLTALEPRFYTKRKK